MFDCDLVVPGEVPGELPMDCGFQTQLISFPGELTIK
jgi:hypothetical protein